MAASNPNIRLYRPGLREVSVRAVQAFGFLGNYLYPLEHQLLRELLSRLAGPVSARIQSQLACYDLYQRGGLGWTELQMFAQTPTSSRELINIRLDVDAEDMRLASFRFRTVLSPDSRHVVFHLVRGQLFTLTFGEPYKGVRFQAALIEEAKLSPLARGILESN